MTEMSTKVSRPRPVPPRPPAAQPPTGQPKADRPPVGGLNRLAVAGLLLATGVAGLLFAPVFGVAPLVLPLLVVVLTAYGCVELCAAVPVLAAWRPLLVAVAGLLGLVESVLFPTTVAGLPTGSSLAAIGRGFTTSWQLTLQSTWPARPDPDQLLFVPLAVLVALTIGLELLLRLQKPLLALLPGLAVVGVAQAYQALSGLAGTVAVAGFVAPAVLLLWAQRADRPTRPPSAVWALLTVVAVGVGAVALGALDPAGRPPARLSGSSVSLAQNEITNPLDQIAERLTQPNRAVFRYRAAAPVDRWRLAVLAGFDGANWSTDVQLRRLGVNRNGAPGATTRTADVQLDDLPGPWLPSQAEPLGVDGVTPLVDQNTGTLLRDQSTTSSYRLTWSEPNVAADTLGVAPVDAGAPGGLGDVGQVPPGIDQLAQQAVHGLRPTFQSALALERFLSRDYTVADADLPTGSGWPQLREFLTGSRRGTSEQFAAAYVVLARMTGIPARLVVGFRGTTTERDSNGYYVVRDRDVLAWPEVAVAGVGWVPLDPTAGAAHSGAGAHQPVRTGLAGAVQQARTDLPADNNLRPAQLPWSGADSSGDPGGGVGAGTWALIVAYAVVGSLVCWLFGVPLTVFVRARRRRGRSGADGVLGAWAEARDRLRAHGVPYRIGMTPRDVASSGAALVGEPTTHAVIALSRVVDIALWSRVPPTEDRVRGAWDEVRVIRRGLAARSRGARLRAAVDPRVLFPPRRRRWR